MEHNPPAGWRFDFSRNGTLDTRWRRRFDAVVSRCRRSFTALTDVASAAYGTDIHWWVSELACRNTLTNDFFLQYCRIHFIRELVAEGEAIAEIRVDSLAFGTVLEQCLGEGPTRVIREGASLWERVCNLSSQAARYVLFCLETFLRAALAWWLYPPDRKPFVQDTTFIDTFVFAESFAEGKYHDRYYGGFARFLDEDERQRLVYVPTLMVGARGLASLLRTIRNANVRFLLKEDVLRWSDLVWACCFVFQALRRKPERWVEDGIDFTPLAREVWRDHLFSPNSVIGLMNYRFAQRLKEARAPVSRVIDWFENQIVDKGFNAGFRRFFPEAAHIGYEGFVTTPNYLCLYVSRQEQASGVVPTTVAVTGPAMISAMREFCPDLDVRAAPGFRFSWLWQPFESDPAPSFCTILVALDVTLEASADILLCAMEAVHQELPKNVRFWVKPHPAAIPFGIFLERLGLTLPPEFTVIQGDFSAVLKKADMILSNTSSTCMEAVVLGIPVLIAGSRSGFSRNPIPAGVPGEMWRLCLTPEDTGDAIRSFHGRVQGGNRRKELGRELREAYFSKVTPEAVRAFVGITDGR